MCTNWIRIIRNGRLSSNPTPRLLLVPVEGIDTDTSTVLVVIGGVLIIVDGIVIVSGNDIQ